jgi:hypothetical protein
MKREAHSRVLDTSSDIDLDDTATLPLPILPNQFGAQVESLSRQSMQLDELLELARSIDARLDKLQKPRATRKKSVTTRKKKPVSIRKKAVSTRKKGPSAKKKTTPTTKKSAPTTRGKKKI